MRAVTFLLRTLQPLLATSLQGDPNSSVSFSYVPGSLLRGALIGRYLSRRPNDGLDLLDDAGARRLFFDGSTRYLHAYPSDDRRRTLPVPRSWFTDKGVAFGDGVTSISVHDHTWEIGEGEDFTPTPLGARYCSVTGRTVTLVEERRRVTLHNARARARGCATAEEGAVFRYDALDADQSFRGVVLCDHDDDAAIIVELLQTGDLWMGGSRSAGYGRTEVREVTIVDDWSETAGLDGDVDEDEDEDGEVEDEAGEEMDEDEVDEALDEDEDEVDEELAEGGEEDGDAPGASDGGEQGTLVLTLLSDLIARDEYGQHAAALPLEEIRVLLELEKLTCARAFAGSTMVGGFNQKWGLPLPQVQALTAGSVFVCEWEGTLKSEFLHALVTQGIGERRVDGFGRLAVDWPGRSSTLTGVQPDPAASTDQRVRDAENGGLDDASKVVAADMARRLVRHRLDEILLNQVGRLSLDPLHLSRSQLARLAIVARHALTSDNGKPSPKPVTTLLDNLPSNAGDQYARSRMQPGNRSFDAQIRDWLTKPGSWIANPPESTVAGQAQALTDPLRLEYTLRLIMAMAKRASKESLR